VAAFGDDKADLDRLVNQNAESWVRQQMNMTHQPYLRQTLDRLAAMNGEGPQNSAHNIVFWKRMISNDDQLQQYESHGLLHGYSRRKRFRELQRYLDGYYIFARHVRLFDL
jgi:hypothetical protein